MITDSGKCGVLYEAGNEAALLAALNGLDKLDVKEKQELCLNYFKEKLSFAAIAKRIKEIVAEL